MGARVTAGSVSLPSPSRRLDPPPRSPRVRAMAGSALPMLPTTMRKRRWPGVASPSPRAATTDLAVVRHGGHRPRGSNGDRLPPHGGGGGSKGGEAWYPSPTWIRRRPPSPHVAAANLMVGRHGGGGSGSRDGSGPDPATATTRRETIFWIFSVFYFACG